LIAGGIRRLLDVFVLLFLSLCLLGNSAPDLMAGQFARYIKYIEILQRAPFLSKLVSVSKLCGNSRLTV